MGLRHIVNNRTQNESPCRIPLFSVIGPILALPSLVCTSKVIFQFFMMFLISAVIFVGSP